jgi:Domain of unknown function (DUF2804), C-terminal
MSESITTPSPRDTPPARAGPPSALIRSGRPLKRWRYVGVFAEELMLCAAIVQVGFARQTFWALAIEGEPLRERTRLRPRRGEVRLGVADPAAGTPGTLGISDRGVEIRLDLDEQPGIRARCPHGRCEVWTRKQAGIAARGTIALDGGPARELRALAVIDDTAGHHARRTEWRWSAGVGTAPDGTALAWNLVSGVNDPPTGSERAVWVGGVPHEVGPVRFAADLTSIGGEDGSLLSFEAEAERSRRENLVLVRSYYRAPFGSFSGALPGGIELAAGRGVMEHHLAHW